MGRKIPCVCENCGAPCEKTVSEFNRSQKLGRKHFCGLSCANSFNNKEVPRGTDNWKKIEKWGCGGWIDEFSPFRFFIRRKLFAKRSTQKKRKRLAEEMKLTPDILREIWLSQKGKCPYTGWDLTLPRDCMKWPVNNNKMLRASLDRIDSDKGYEKQNIEFVTLMANYAKTTGTHEDVIRLAIDIVHHSQMVFDLGPTPHTQELNYFLRNARMRQKERPWKSVSININHLKLLWKKQRGKCAYTGRTLILPPSSNGFVNPKDVDFNASLDRIDSSVSYTPRNIQWVCRRANLAKQAFTPSELYTFAKAVTEKAKAT